MTVVEGAVVDGDGAVVVVFGLEGMRPMSVIELSPGARQLTGVTPFESASELVDAVPLFGGLTV